MFTVYNLEGEKTLKAGAFKKKLKITKWDVVARMWRRKES